MSEFQNGNYGDYDECLTQSQFKHFVENEWRAHTKLIGDTMEHVARSVAKMANVLQFAAKWLIGLMALLVLVNAASTLIYQLRDSTTHFKGTIGGNNGASIELHPDTDYKR